MKLSRMKVRWAAAGLGALLALGGCNQHASEADKAAAAQSAAQAAAANQQQADEAAAARRGIHAAVATLDEVPPPSKARYLGVRTAQAWVNPFLIVSRKTITLRFLNLQDIKVLPNKVLPDQTLRPIGPRKSALTLSLIDLPEALAALPEESWEYGRVVAVDEDSTTPRRERPQMRRNVEAVMAMLNDLDVVAYEWPGR